MQSKMVKFYIILSIFVIASFVLNSVNSQCALNAPLIAEIRNYQPVVNEIIEKVLNGDFKGKLFDDTAVFVDTIGSRVVGSQGLDNGIDYILNWMREQNFDDVHGEEIVTPNWKRGNEILEMIEPRYQKLKILGYGSTVGTTEPIEAEIIVVRNYTELAERSSEVPGKIVVFDHTYISYGVSNVYRATGAAEIAKLGGVAGLVAAVSNQAMDLPHTGSMNYNADVSIPRIPLASISIDAAQMLGRMHRRGDTIKLRIVMEDENLGTTTSRNTFGQLNGSVFPNETVIVSGHIDSWDVGQGAQDDGGAVVMSVLVISLLKSLQLTPRRTIQAVGWTSEENGLIGVQGYIRTHLEEINAGKIAAAFESDSGLFSPFGYDFAGTDDGACVVEEIMNLFEAVNFTNFSRYSRVGSDVSYLSDLQVPTFNFVTNNEKYFWYHHADSDTMSALDSDDLDKCLAVYAASAYVVADLSQSLSRSVDTENGAPNTTSAFIVTLTVAIIVCFRNMIADEVISY